MTQVFEDRTVGTKITAMRFTGGLLNVEKINAWIRGAGRESRWEMPIIGKKDDGTSYRTREEYMEIKTVQGWKPVQLGEWIVRFSSGAFWSFTPENFRDSYRPVTVQIHTKETMPDIKSATYLERPNEYKAMQFDTVESYETMVEWLYQVGCRPVSFVKPLDGFGQPYIKYDQHKLFVGSWVVVDEKAQLSKVFTDEEFQKEYMPKIDPIFENTPRIMDIKLHKAVAPTLAELLEYPGIKGLFNSIYGNQETDEGHVGIEKELEHLINRYSGESVSGTPDFILAKFLIETLKNYNEAVSRRAEWRGETCEFKPSVVDDGDGKSDGSEDAEDPITRAVTALSDFYGFDRAVARDHLRVLDKAGISVTWKSVPQDSKAESDL